MTRSYRRSRLIVGAAAVIGTGLLVVSCSSGSDSAKGTGGAGIGQSGAGKTSGDTIRVGLLSTLDGPFAVLGESANQGAKVALLDAGGKLDGKGPRDGVTGATAGGKKIQLFIESSDTTPDVAVQAVRKLVEQDNVNVFVGPLSGDEGLAIKNYLKKHPDVTMINGTSGAQNLTLRDPLPNIFRFDTDGAQWMAGLGTYAAETLKYKKVVTVAEDYSFPYDQVGGFATEYCSAGGAISDRIWVPLGTKDFASYITKIPKDVDAIYVALGGADALNFVKQYDQFNGSGTPILGGSITVDSSILKGLGKRVDGVVSAGPVAPVDTPEYKAYSEALKKAYPDAPPPGLFDTLYYTEMKALLLGLDKVKGNVSGNQQALRTTLSSLSFDSPQGPVKLDSNRQAIANNYLFKIVDGKNQLLKTIPNVNQTLGKPAAQYTAQPAFDRTHPSC